MSLKPVEFKFISVMIIKKGKNMNSALIRFFTLMLSVFFLVLFSVLVLLRVIAFESLNAYTNIALWGIVTLLVMLFLDASKSFYYALKQMNSNSMIHQNVSKETQQLLEYHQTLVAHRQKK